MQPQKETLFHALMPLVSLFAERFRHMMLSSYLIIIFLSDYVHPEVVHIVSGRSSFSSTKPNDSNHSIKLFYMDLLILRDRTDGRSAGNPHVSKACNCLVSQTKHIIRHEALPIGSIGYDFTFNVFNHVS